MHGKGESSKTEGSIYNIPIAAANICNILPRSAVYNGLIVVLKYRDGADFGPVLTHIIYEIFAYLKSHDNFYEDVSIIKGLSSEDMFRFSKVVETQEENGSVTEKKKNFRWERNE